MDDYSASTAPLDQTDEDILTSTVSDEALAAATGPERGVTKEPTTERYLSLSD
jgi:hypothetical protein